MPGREEDGHGRQFLGGFTLRGSQPRPRSVSGSGRHVDAGRLHRREYHGVQRGEFDSHPPTSLPRVRSNRLDQRAFRARATGCRRCSGLFRSARTEPDFRGCRRVQPDNNELDGSGAARATGCGDDFAVIFRRDGHAAHAGALSCSGRRGAEGATGGRIELRLLAKSAGQRSAYIWEKPLRWNVCREPSSA